MIADGPWAQFGPRHRGEDRASSEGSAGLRTGATFVLLVAGAAIAQPTNSALGWLVLAAVAGATTGAMARAAAGSPKVEEPIVAAVAGAVISAWLIDLPLGVGFLVGGLVATWVCLDRHPPAVPAIEPDVAPAIVASIAGTAFLAWLEGETPAVLLVVPLAALVVAALRPAWIRGVGSALSRGAAVAAGAVVRALLGLVGLIVVCGPWALQRVTRWDPTWVPRRAGTRWVERSSVDGRDDRMWDPDPRLLRTTARRRIHRVGVTVATLVVVLIGAGLVLIRIQDQQFRAKYEGAAALQDSPWAVDLQRTVDDAFARGDLTSYHGVSMPDTTSEHVNITDGVRATWQPPASSCRPIRIWMLGGSAMFGLGQRDDHTIASALAKQAWEEGIPLAIENRGVPADVHWLEARRIEDAVLSGTEPPDRVIFYDGTNDLDVQSYLNGVGLGGTRLFASYPDGKELRAIQSDNERRARLWALVHGGSNVSSSGGTSLDTEGVAAIAAKGYAAAGDLIAPFLAEHDIAETWFYQPSRASRSTPVPAELGSEPFDANRAALEQAFRRQLPDRVVDLSAALDDDLRPLYYDWVHTNEDGAEIVAAAMLDHLREDLQADLAEQGQGPCR